MSGRRKRCSAEAERTELTVGKRCQLPMHFSQDVGAWFHLRPGHSEEPGSPELRHLGKSNVKFFKVTSGSSQSEEAIPTYLPRLLIAYTVTAGMPCDQAAQKGLNPLEQVDQGLVDKPQLISFLFSYFLF